MPTEGIEKWLGVPFETSYSSVTSQFMQFNKDYKEAIKDKLPEGYKIVEWDRGHFYIFAFIQGKKGKYIYLNIPDVRYSPDAWYKRILLRSARDIKDFTGGHNKFSSFINLKEEIARL